jgi:predicted phosphodiesterase
MRILLYSDLHTEFWRKEAELKPLLQLGKACVTDSVRCDVVVLAGDIASGRTNTKKVLKQFANAYAHVVYVPGNHEYYGSDIATFDDIGELPSNVYLLNPGKMSISDRDGDIVTFIGATLWTNFHYDVVAEMAAKDMITDFRLIKNFKPTHAIELYRKHIDYIKHMYETTPGKKVIVTHFLPAYECISRRFRDGNLLNKYFANELDNWIANLSNTTWLFGHTHDSMDLTLGDTRLVCNPYGYMGSETNREFTDKVIVV